ncbi:hypothetical protein BHM03_00004131 [Ensete ventricosum]|nr:hypothetical protein BHM03_00004131 [Ensete ventricosum]
MWYFQAVVVRAFMEENFQVYAGSKKLCDCLSSLSKNVVFGKIVSGSNLLKKIEQAGSEKGKPLCLVKIVDCGEASDGKTQVAPGKEKGKSWGMQVVTKSMHVLRSSSSDSESEATSSSSSTGSERSGQRGDTRKPKHSLQSADTSVEVGK